MKITVKEACILMNLSISAFFVRVKRKRIKLYTEPNGYNRYALKHEIEEILNLESEIKEKFKQALYDYTTLNISINELSRKYNLNNGPITNFLKQNGVAIKPAKDFKTIFRPLDEQFFDVIDSEIKAYFLGLLWADGCNLTKTGKIQISLQERDGHILKQISEDFFGQDLTRYKIRDETRQNQYMLNIHNYYMSGLLNNYGFNSTRNFWGGMPKCKIPKNIFHHFLRGLFDGDGSIYFINFTKDYAFQFIGSPFLCDDLKKIIKEYYDFDINCVNELKFSKPMKRLNIHGNIKTKLFLDQIYQDASIFIKRKYEKYLEIKPKRISKF